MKAFYILIILVFSILLPAALQAQAACPCQPIVYMTPDPADPCCYLLNIDFTTAPGCSNPTNFNQITVNTAVGGGTGTIAGATAAASSFSAAINTPTFATFSAAPGFILSVPQNYVVGQICFANQSPAFFPAQMTISNGPVDNCAISYFQDDLTTICTPGNPCDSLFLADTSICSTDPNLLMPLQGCSSITCLTQVRWWIQSPCGIGPWILYQVKPDCSDLLLFPPQFSTDICVYVEATTDGTCNCPQTITTNTAKVLLCDPASCFIQNTTPEICDCGTPAPITVQVSGGAPSCPFTVAWYDEQGNIVGNTATYAPPTLCFQGPPDDCYQDYIYKAVITSPCGKDSCLTVFRVYNKDAPKGKLEMDPVETQPFCPGEDATLKFTPGCAGNPKMWDWYVRPCVGGSATHLTEAGKMNPLLLTNKLFQSAYFYVQAQNGVCPADTSQLLIEVKAPPSIIAFSAAADPCVELQVNLNLDFALCTIQGCNTGCNCTHTVEWYKDGFVIGTSAGVLPPAAFTYTSINPLAGNYYAVLKDDCCQGSAAVSALVKIEPVCVPVIKGPCFMCNGMPVVLEGEMVLPPRFPCPTTSLCTFQWYELVAGVEVNQNNQTQLFTATHPGIYIFESNCNGCIKRDTFNLPGCTNNCSCGNLAWADFWQGTTFTTSIDSNFVVTTPCPKAGMDFLIHGDLPCLQTACNIDVVDWELTRPAPLPPVLGTSPVWIYPHFDAILPWADCLQPGLYTLKVTRYCGVVPCSYVFRFEVPNCGCLCDDLAADGGKGFGVGSGINCIRSLKPYALDACDVVTWAINGNPAPGSSVGNSGFNYDFSSLGSGSYVVCMTVTRTPIAGPPCTFTKCQTILVNCGGAPSPRLCLAGNTAKNGSFTDGLIRGHLGNGVGEVADWHPLPGVSEALIFVDDAAGGYDDGYLVFVGGFENPARIYQESSLVEAEYVNVAYNRRNLSGERLPPGSRLEFRLYSDLDGTAQQLLFTDPIETSPDTGWVSILASVDISPNPDFPYLVIVLAKGEIGSQSIVAMDNLEICSSSSPLGTKGKALANHVFRLFPNPAADEITIEWKGLELKRGSAQIYSSLGQLLTTIPIREGSHQLTASIASLPKGLYFVNILSGRKQLKVLKFVKS
jgi:hypothetical protein